MDNTIIIAIIGLGGVIIGALISLITGIRIKSKESKLRILEKVFDKRILAHESVLEMVKIIRTVVPTNQKDEENNLITYPICFHFTKVEFNEFKNDIVTRCHTHLHWLGTDLERELFYLQDYIINLDVVINKVPENRLTDIGVIIKQDFIDLASSIEELAFNFFRKDIYKVEINKHDQWHKHPKQVTLNKLENTCLMKNKKKINLIIESRS